MMSRSINVEAVSIVRPELWGVNLPSFDFSQELPGSHTAHLSDNMLLRRLRSWEPGKVSPNKGLRNAGRRRCGLLAIAVYVIHRGNVWCE
jgi:hypothetical protein